VPGPAGSGGCRFATLRVARDGAKVRFRKGFHERALGMLLVWRALPANHHERRDPDRGPPLQRLRVPARSMLECPAHQDDRGTLTRSVERDRRAVLRTDCLHGLLPSLRSRWRRPTAPGGLRALLLREGRLAKPHVRRRHLDALVLPDELERLLEHERALRVYEVEILGCGLVVVRVIVI